MHQGKPVKAWLEDHEEEIAIYHLHSYRPELNPDERLNRSLKSTLSHLPSAKDERSLQKQIIGRPISCPMAALACRIWFA